MSTQREIPTTVSTKCVCGRLPRTYRTDNTLFHLECYPCQHITIRLSKQVDANAEWFRMMQVKRNDSPPKLVTVEDMAEGVRQ